MPSLVIDTLSEEELDALLLHESTHVRRRDPLRLVVAAFCRDLFFFLPVTQLLFSRLQQAQEQAADDEAAGTSSPLEVASALVTLLKLAGRRRTVLAAAATGADAEARIRRLLDLPRSDARCGRNVTRTATAVTLSAVVLACLIGLPARAVARAGEVPLVAMAGLLPRARLPGLVPQVCPLVGSALARTSR